MIDKVIYTRQSEDAPLKVEAATFDNGRVCYFTLDAGGARWVTVTVDEQRTILALAEAEHMDGSQS